jgi:hypothetical protein
MSRLPPNRARDDRGIPLWSPDFVDRGGISSSQEGAHLIRHRRLCDRVVKAECFELALSRVHANRFPVASRSPRVNLPPAIFHREKNFVLVTNNFYEKCRSRPLSTGTQTSDRAADLPCHTTDTEGRCDSSFQNIFRTAPHLLSP